MKNILSHCERLRDELEQAEAEKMRVEHPDLEPDKVTLIKGRKWHKLDIGTSGAFVVHAETGIVQGIKAYGVPHHKVIHGPVDKITGTQLLPRRHARANISSITT